MKKTVFQETLFRLSGKSVEANSNYKLILDLRKDKHRVTLSELAKTPFPSLHTINITLNTSDDPECRECLKTLIENCFPRTVRNFYIKGNSIDTQSLREETKAVICNTKEKVSGWLGVWSFQLTPTQFTDILYAHSKTKTIQFYECK